ncbi:MAG: metallophosphoesterase [Pyrinomonadaceae bacterium]|nr:metallophosphoesterase [Pyrinomonadaceae bacterium]MBA3570445.1 metallophosphoesterase [Pyrinomonadaceae bacterium]MDQ3172200.1 metallophosphoesterase [Acidobacteriota bacterium]
MAKLELSRRQFLTGLAAAPLVAVSATSAYARFIEPYRYEVSETDVFLRDLPERFEGFRITQLTDVHHSRIVGIDEVRRTVDLANLTKPDLIALTGDYTTSYRRYIEPCAEALGSLKAPEGVWAVLGNHDHYTDRELTTRALEHNRIAVLNNANTTLRRGSDVLQLSGIDDWSWAGTNWPRALYGLDQKRPTVLLSHQPRVLDLAESEKVGLIISGHTHGGQIDLPLIGPPARFATAELKYAQGLFRRGDTQLYVSRGTGVIGLPLRLGVRPEIAVLRLRRASERTSV